MTRRIENTLTIVSAAFVAIMLNAVIFGLYGGIKFLFAPPIPVIACGKNHHATLVAAPLGCSSINLVGEMNSLVRDEDGPACSYLMCVHD